MNKIVINGRSIEISGGVNVSVVGSRVMVDGVEVDSSIPEDTVIRWEGELVSLDCDKSVTCRSVQGDIKANGSVNCDDVGGSVDAGGSVNCDGVKGNVRAGGSVSCDNIGGDVSAGGSVRRG